MNSRNMEQLIEKYKREMLSYSMRSAIPPDEEPPEEESVYTAPPEAEQEVEAVPIEQEPEAAPEEPFADEMQDESEPEPLPEIPFEELPYEEETPDFEEYLNELNDIDEPVSEAMAVKKFRAASVRSDDYTSPLDDLVDSKEELRLSLLRESCRKIAAGEADGTDAQKESCTELYNFFAVNTGTGSISVETYASDQVFGVGSARVMIFIPLESGNVMVFDGLTDVNGSTVKVTLPAPPKELSLSPDEKTLPYARYTILVEHPNYSRAVYYDVPVFEGIESIQPVQMLAKIEGEDVPAPIVVDEREPSDLD